MSAFTYQVFRFARTNADRWRPFDTGPGNVVWGVDGDPAVYKNDKLCLKDQNSLYHIVLGCVVVDGQTQPILDDVAYTYNSIP